MHLRGGASSCRYNFFPSLKKTDKKYAWKLEKLPECNGDEKDFKIPEINRERKKDIDTIRKFLINNGISMDNILDEELEWRWHIGLIDELTYPQASLWDSLFLLKLNGFI